MKTLLAFSPSELPDSVLDRLKERRVQGRSTGIAVRVLTRSGRPLDIAFAPTAVAVPRGTTVYVWWSVGGPVCAPVAEVDAEEARSSSISRQVELARATLAKARLDRPLRHAVPMDIPL